jgi:hypothetical protein
MLTPIMKVRWDDFRKTYNVLHASCTTLGEDLLVRRLTIPDLVSDANINTLVELSDVQFTEAAMADTILKQIMWVVRPTGV